MAALTCCQMFLRLLVLSSSLSLAQSSQQANNVCANVCSETALPFPLDGLASEWSAGLFSSCNYTCHVAQCTRGCGSFSSSVNIDACLNECESSVSKAACRQGCHLALGVTRSQLKEVLESAVLVVEPTNAGRSPPGVDLRWSLPRAVFERLLPDALRAAGALGWTVQATSGVSAAWSSLPDALQFDQQLRAALSMQHFNGSPLQSDWLYQFRLVASLPGGGGSVVASRVFEHRTGAPADVPPPRPPVITLELQQLRNQFLVCWRLDDGADLAVRRLFQVRLRNASAAPGGDFTDTTSAFCYVFTYLIDGQSYEAQIAEKNTIGAGPAALSRFTLASRSSRVSQIIFADSRKVYSIVNEADFLSNYDTIVNIELDAPSDKISAIASPSVGVVLVGTQAGHVLRYTLGSEPGHAETLRRADGAELGVSVREIASDWIQDVIYILFDHSILVCDADCINRRSLTFPNFPGGISHITPDPWNGYLYWLGATGVYRAPLPPYGEWQTSTDLEAESLGLADATAVALDLFSAALLVTTRNGSVLSRSLVSGAVRDVRVDRLHAANRQSHANARRLAVDDRARLFWLADGCLTRPVAGCLNSEEEIHDQFNAAGQRLVNLNSYVMDDTIGRLVDLAWLADKPTPMSIPACSNVDLLQSVSKLRLRWRPPPLQLFQSSSEWRRLTYDIKVGDAIRQQNVTADLLDFEYRGDAAEQRASVRACWAGVCSAWTERTTTTEKRDLSTLPLAFLDSHSAVQTISLLGEAQSPSVNIATPGPSMDLVRQCFEYDPLADQTYWCTTEGVVRATRGQSNAQLVVHAGDFRWSALLSSQAVIALASPYHISGYRLTGTFFKSYYSCDVGPTSTCSTVEGVAPVEREGAFLYLLRDQSDLVSSYVVGADGLQSSKVSVEARQMPRLKQLRSHGFQVFAITQDDRLILFDHRLTKVNRFLAEQQPILLLNSAPAVGSEALAPASDIAVLRTRNGSTFVQWTPPSGRSVHAVVSRITIHSADGQWRDATLARQQLALPASLVDGWAAGAELRVDVAATIAWQATVGSAAASAPAKPPGAVRDVRLHVAHEQTPYNSSALVELTWQPPSAWNGEPNDYKVNCWEDGTAGRVHLMLNARVPLEPRVVALAGLGVDTLVHCQIVAVNTQVQPADYPKPLYVETKVANPYVRLFAIESHFDRFLDLRTVSEPKQLGFHLKAIGVLGDYVYAITLDNRLAKFAIDSPAEALFEMTTEDSEGRVPQLNQIATDWVGERLFLSGGSDGLTLYEALLPEDSTQKVIRLKTLAVLSSSPRSIVFDPMQSRLYYTDDNGKLIEFDLLSLTETDMASRIDCLKRVGKISAALEADFKLWKARSPSLLLVADAKLYTIDPAIGSCNLHDYSNNIDAAMLSKVTGIAVGNGKLYMSTDSAELLLFDANGGTTTSQTLTAPIASLKSASRQFQPFAGIHCLQLAPASSATPTVHVKSKTSALVAVAEPTVVAACRGISRPPTTFVARAALAGSTVCGIDCVQVTARNRSLLLEHLRPYTRYEARVSWFNSYSDSSSLSLAAHFESSYGFPSRPRQLHVFSRTPDSVALFWQLPENTSAPLDQLRYIIYLEKRAVPSNSTMFSDEQQMEPCVETLCSAVVDQLDAATVFRFRVLATHVNYSTATYEKRDQSAFSRVVMAATLPLPGRLTATATSRNLTLGWLWSNGEDVAGVMLQLRETGDAAWTNATAAPIDARSPSTHIVGGLRPSTSYDIGYLAAYNFTVPNTSLADLPIDGYAPVYFQKKEGVLRTTAEPPSAVNEVSVAADAEGLYVVWQPPDSDGGADITAFVLEYRPSPDAEWIRIDDAISPAATIWRPTKQHAFADLTTSSHYRMAAQNEQGLGPFSEGQRGAKGGAGAVVSILIALLVVVVLFIIVALLFVILWRRREKKRDAKLPPILFTPGAINEGLVDESPLPPVDVTRQIPAEELRALPHVPRSCITIARMLGKGAFGEVYEGLACNLPRVGPKSVRVAIKTLKQGSSDHERLKFLKEAIMMSNFNHANILRLLGVCLEAEPHWIVLELMEGGDLLSFLRSARPSEVMPSQVSLADLLSMAADVLKGCTYLEDNHHVHRDLAARNCLVSTRHSGTKTVKIADFGLARDIYEEDYYRVDGQGFLPVRWMAPESMTDGVFTTKSDVWSFGVVLWEILSLGQQPYPGRHNLDVLNYVRIGGRLQSPKHCPTELYEVMQQCWSFRPEDRPTFSAMQTRMQKLRQLPSLSGEQPFPPEMCAPLPRSAAGTTNHAFEGSGSAGQWTSIQLSDAATPTADDAARIFSTAKSGEFPRNGDLTHSLRNRDNILRASQRGMRSVFRSLRKQKKVRPPSPPVWQQRLGEVHWRTLQPSRVALESRPSSRSTTTTRPGSGVSSSLSTGAESYTTSREGYEVPLIKGLTNAARLRLGGADSSDYAPSRHYGTLNTFGSRSPAPVSASSSLDRSSVVSQWLRRNGGSFSNYYAATRGARPKRPAPPPPPVAESTEAVQYADVSPTTDVTFREPTSPTYVSGASDVALIRPSSMIKPSAV